MKQPFGVQMIWWNLFLNSRGADGDGLHRAVSPFFMGMPRASVSRLRPIDTDAQATGRLLRHARRWLAAPDKPLSTVDSLARVT